MRKVWRSQRGNQEPSMAWYIRYIWYWNLQFLLNVIINKIMVLLPQAPVTLAPPSGTGDLSWFWLFCLGSLVHFLLTILTLIVDHCLFICLLLSLCPHWAFLSQPDSIAKFDIYSEKIIAKKKSLMEEHFILLLFKWCVFIPSKNELHSYNMMEIILVESKLEQFHDSLI
jgi:hypothetical protein